MAEPHRLPRHLFAMRTPAEAILSDTFWTNTGHAFWPTDPPGWIFLGRAANALAERMFGDYGKTCFSQWMSGAVYRAKDEDWERHLIEQGGRVGAVQEKLREWCEPIDGVETGLRPKAGGKMLVVPHEVWSNQQLSNWFMRCQMHRRDPYSRAFAGEGFEHIFLRSDQFLTKLNSLASPVIDLADEVPEAVGVHLSPYLRLMLTVAKNSRISPDDQVTVECLKGYIAELAPSFGLEVNPKHIGGKLTDPVWSPSNGNYELTFKLFDAMPTLLREIWTKR